MYAESSSEGPVSMPRLYGSRAARAILHWKGWKLRVRRTHACPSDRLGFYGGWLDARLMREFRESHNPELCRPLQWRWNVEIPRDDLFPDNPSAP